MRCVHEPLDDDRRTPEGGLSGNVWGDELAGERAPEGGPGRAAIALGKEGLYGKMCWDLRG